MTASLPAAALPARASPSDSSDAAALLADLRFTDAAPKSLAAAAREGDVERFARALRKRGLPPAPVGKRAGLLWPSLTHLFPAGESSTLDLLTRELLLSCARTESPAGANDLAALLEVIDNLAAPEPRHLAAWLALLPAAAPGSDPELVFRLWRLLLVECRRLAGETAAAAPLELLQEVRFRAGVLFQPLEESAAWLHAAREEWRTWLTQACDEQGMPRSSRTSPALWLGALARTTADALSADVELWREEELQRLGRLAERLAAFVLPGRGLIFATEDSEPALTALRLLLKWTGWKKQSAPRRLVEAAVEVASASCGREARSRAQSRRPVRIQPRSVPATQSDCVRRALLRTDWSPDASLCAIDHSGPQVVIEVALTGEPWLAGTWELELSLDDAPLPLAGGWKCDCWYSDDEGDFLELACELGAGMAAVRQVFLARQASLLVLMDAVRGVSPQRRLVCRSRWPLAAAAAAEQDGLTREIQLASRRGRVRVFPVHLPPLRAASAPGALEAGEDELLCSLKTHGSACQVLLLDWSDRDGQAPADWTPLSVAEEGRRLSASEAVAARLRVGDRHWFYWHNLTRGKVARSALGHHSASETVVARFSSQGTVEPLVHVEPEAEPEPAASESSSRPAAGDLPEPS